jgi:hypothetical protein
VASSSSLLISLLLDCKVFSHAVVTHFHSLASNLPFLAMDLLDILRGFPLLCYFYIQLLLILHLLLFHSTLFGYGLAGHTSWFPSFMLFLHTVATHFTLILSFHSTLFGHGLAGHILPSWTLRYFTYTCGSFCNYFHVLAMDPLDIFHGPPPLLQFFLLFHPTFLVMELAGHIL